jgi:hypothetical protein
MATAPKATTVTLASDPPLSPDVVTLGPDNVIDINNLPPIILEGVAVGDKVGNIQKFVIDQSQLQASVAFNSAVKVAVQTFFSERRGYNPLDPTLVYRATDEFISLGNTSTTVATLSSIMIVGNTSVTKGTTTGYTITSTFSDGTTSTSTSGLTLTSSIGSFTNGQLVIPADATVSQVTLTASKGSVTSGPKVITLTNPVTTTPPVNNTRRAVTFENSNNIVATTNTLTYTNSQGLGYAQAGSNVSFPAGSLIDTSYEAPILGAGSIGISSVRGQQTDGAANAMFVGQNDVNGKVVARSGDIYYASTNSVPSGSNTKIRLYGANAVKAQYSTDGGLTWNGLYSDSGAEAILNVSGVQWIKYFNAAGTSITQNITVGDAAVFNPLLT